MTEYERVREQALLTDEEIEGYCVRISTSPEDTAFTKDDGTLVSPSRCRFVNVKGILQAQLDKALKTDGIEIRADDQSLPESILSTLAMRLVNATVKVMLKAGFVKIAPKPSPRRK